MLTRKDFISDIPVKWCAGCGNFIILSQLQNTFANIGIPKENIVVVSGIGCAGRLPYYMDTYGFHTIHGRAPTIATGIKLTKPELQTWVLTGDGDGLSIGGNHLYHAMRKNIGLKIVMLNNQIYALTKGQVSPTSQVGSVTKTTPLGSIDNPINPIKFAIGAECAFVARSIDTEISLTQEILDRAVKSDSTVFIEILQKCVTFEVSGVNQIRDRELKEELILRIRNGEPLIYGKNKDKGIVIENFKPKIISFNPENIPENIVIYDETNDELAYIISNLNYPEFPIPVGIFKTSNRTSYEKNYNDELKRNNIKDKSLKEILYDYEVIDI
ncbi:MAG: 2-oxoacid:ferredoxin oxidoreductase subunit beta [Candidatus Gracilibacteria bacterium]|nr:2-oxoacid:ferredoxin oxidoreductase subunit beta [Candidatus Gracilibacteria bacterium]